MSYINGLNDYSDNYREYGEKILAKSRAALEQAGIEVFPEKQNTTDGNVDSCVIIRRNQPNNTTQPKEVKKEKISQNKENGADWIRESMPSTHNNTGMASTISNSVDKKVAKGMANLSAQATNIANNTTNNVNNNHDDDDIDNDMSFDSSDLFDIEENGNDIEEMFDSNDDQGSGKSKLLKNYFEKSVTKGFSSNNFAGSKFERNITDNTSDLNITAYSDNLYCTNNEKTSVIFGGTASLNYMHKEDTNRTLDYNTYAYMKHKDSYFTYGGGAIHNNKDGVKNTEINVGAMENSTGIYAIFQKEITAIPGKPKYTSTHVDVGIGRKSGLLNPDEYNPKNSKIEEIGGIDSKEAYVEGKQSNLYVPDDKPADGHKNPLPNSTIDLIIEDTNNHKEYGIKFAQYFGHKTKNNNYAFVQPFGKISNTVVEAENGDESKEGATLLLGANAGQNITFGNGWNLKTKGLLEVSRNILTGYRPSDTLIANARVIAENSKFKGELGIGTFIDSAKNFCNYAETKLSYVFNKHFNAYAKAGYASYRIDSHNQEKIFEAAIGARYTF